MRSSTRHGGAPPTSVARAPHGTSPFPATRVSPSRSAEDLSGARGSPSTAPRAADAPPRGPVDPDLQPARQVLAEEVDDVPSGRVTSDVLHGAISCSTRMGGAGSATRRRESRGSRHRTLRHPLSSKPIASQPLALAAGRGARPSAGRHTGDRGELAPPLAVGDHPLAGAVGEGDHELREQFGGGAVVRASPLGVEPSEAGRTSHRRAASQSRSRPPAANPSRHTPGTGPAGRSRSSPGLGRHRRSGCRSAVPHTGRAR